jgi:hypothetical protein
MEARMAAADQKQFDIPVQATYLTHAVVTAATPEEALKAVEDGRWDFIDSSRRCLVDCQACGDPADA